MGDSSKIAVRAREKREAKRRAQITREIEIIERLLAMLPAGGLVRAPI